MRVFQRNRRHNIRFANGEIVRINDILSGKKPLYLKDLKDAFSQAEYFLQYNDWAAQKAQAIINRHTSLILTLTRYLDNIDDKEYAQGADYSIKGSEQLAAEKTWAMLVEQKIIK